MKWLGGLLGGGQRRGVELDAVQQIALLCIAGLPVATEHHVFAEVSLRRSYIGWEETYMALRKLVREGLVEEDRDAKDRTRTFRITSRGRTITRYLPAEPSSKIRLEL